MADPTPPISLADCRPEVAAFAIRDRLAAAALQGIVANRGTMRPDTQFGDPAPLFWWTPAQIATKAYELADAMLAARQVVCGALPKPEAHR